ncbi:MAG: hypothetical protein L0J03_12385 [Brevibacterium sp.]|nr:hypothetical protein [Brevibacterium sp.]
MGSDSQHQVGIEVPEQMQRIRVEDDKIIAGAASNIAESTLVGYADIASADFGSCSESSSTVVNQIRDE